MSKRFGCLTLTTAILLAVSAGAQETIDSSTCVECHGVEGSRPLGEEPDGMSLYLADWEVSAHAGLECSDCHAGIEDLPHESPFPRVDCSTCHSVESERYATSAHGRGFAAGDTLAPSCGACHDPHRLRSSDDPESILHRTRLAALCT